MARRTYPCVTLRGSALLQLVLFGSACTSWRVASADPASLIANQKPSVIRVTERDSSRLVLSDPTLQGDSLYGYPVASAGTDSTSRVALRLVEVLAIETRRPDPNKTTLLGVGIAVATFSLLCAADALGCGPEENTIALRSIGER